MDLTATPALLALLNRPLDPALLAELAELAPITADDLL